MSSKITFKIEKSLDDYCMMCQQLGESDYGVKTHRSWPTQTWQVKSTWDGETKYFILCSDCLNNANKSEEVEEVLEPDGTPFTEKNKFFLR